MATLLVVRTGDEVGIGILDPNDAQVQNGHNLAGEPRDRLTFDVATDQLHPVDPAVSDELVRRGAWARCVQTIGALDAAAALSVDHTANESNSAVRSASFRRFSTRWPRWPATSSAPALPLP